MKNGKLKGQIQPPVNIRAARPASMTRPRIGVALMARDGAETLPRCLDSLRPFVSQIVVGIDTLTKDKTRQVATRHGADLTFPLVVSEYHECAQHGRLLAQHFAKARNQTFARLDPQLDAWLWIDADDYVREGAKLGPVLERLLDSPAVGAWAPYHYATLNDGAQTNTLFDRERLCRVRQPNGEPIIWEWKHRVHEVVAPTNVRQATWLMDGMPAIYHQEGRHKTSASAPRNLLLLEIDLEENPNDHRAMFYLGNQYFALGDWANALYWYDQVTQNSTNHYELWQSWCYASLAYEKLGDLNGAKQAAFAALDVEPRHPEPYQRLASIALLTGQLDQVVFWTEQARSKELPPFYVFKNPLDYSYNVRMPLADALAGLGRVSEARVELEAAYTALPNERVADAIGHYKGLERDQAVANAFLTLHQGQDDEDVIHGYMRAKLPTSVKQFGRLRDRVMPAYLRQRETSGAARIVFWCGHGYEEWSPLSLTTTGIGGSETAVVEIAKRFAAEGWRVDVYNGAGRFEGIYDGVGYWDPSRFRADEHCKVWVSWRQPNQINSKAEKSLLWLHDLNYGPGVAEHLQTWNAQEGATICGVSAWHAQMLERYYGVKADYVPNGIDLARFEQPEGAERVRKNPFQCVYASSPDRGLERLLNLWPALLKREPGATLHVGYGWENIDKVIQSGRGGHLAGLKARCVAAMEKLGESVVWHGRMPQDQLARLYSESAIWTYPTDFLEVSCISAMEAMAGGAVPVTTRVGALPETIGNAGLLVGGMPTSQVWGDYYLNVLIGALTEVNLRKPLEYRALGRATQLTWDAAYDRWKQVLGLELELDAELDDANGIITATQLERRLRRQGPLLPLGKAINIPKLAPLQVPAFLDATRAALDGWLDVAEEVTP